MSNDTIDIKGSVGFTDLPDGVEPNLRDSSSGGGIYVALATAMVNDVGKWFFIPTDKTGHEFHKHMAKVRHGISRTLSRMEVGDIRMAASKVEGGIAIRAVLK